MIINANEARQSMPHCPNKTTEEICMEIKTLAKEGSGSGLFRLTDNQAKEFDLLGYIVTPICGALYSIKWSTTK